MANDTADESTRAAQLIEAQDKAAALFHVVDDRRILGSGVHDQEASAQIKELAAEMFGARRHWHERVIPVKLRHRDDLAAES